jgi:hypothetical protein
MPAVPNPERVQSLRIWHCKFRTLEPIRMMRRLRVLVIATLPDETLAMLGPVSNLRYLSILHLPKVRSLSPLEDLQQLRVLSLATAPGWDAASKVTEVESLDPLAGLMNLEHVALFGVRPRSQSLAALEQCAALRSAQFSMYPRREVARFYAATGCSDRHVPAPDFATEGR